MAIGKAGPDTLDGLVLVGLDYDKTVARTDELLPEGYTVEQAYELGVNAVLGPMALTQYRGEQGLRNRAPSEVVAHLAPHLDPETQRQRSEDLVQAKLDVLAPQIGRRLPDGARWPRLNPGFRTFWHEFETEEQVSTGIGSSGHEAFIRRTFEVHNLSQPDVFVTDDDMRPLMAVIPRVVCEKPSRLVLDVMTQRWLERIGYAGASTDSLALRQRIMSEHLIFAGDDVHKDGDTARNANVQFIHIAPGCTSRSFSWLERAVYNAMERADALI